MADISKIKINNVGYDIKDAIARAGFAYASVIRVNNDWDLQTRLVFYKDAAKTQELGFFDLSYMNIEGLLAKQVFVGEGVTTPVIGMDNLDDGIADSTYITVKKVNGKPVFVFGSTADGSLGTAKTEVTLPVGASGEVALRSQVDAVADDLAALVGTGDVSAAIDSFNEVVNFLNGIDKTDPTLANQLLGINDRIDAIEAVSGTVDDALSGTSTNPVQNKVIKGALDNKANKSELTVTDVTGDTTKKTIQLKTGTSQTVVVEHQDISGKQDTISDLATIRSGAAKGATSVQTFSVNGGTATSPTNGNIDITIPSAAWADVKPSGGVPKSDLASGVQTSLGKADSAIQGVKVNGTELTPDTDKKVSFSAVTGLQFDGSTHVGVVQLPEYVKKSDYNTTIDDIYQSIPSDLADLADDENHRVVTDAEKTTWNNKQNALTFDNVPTKLSTNPVKSGGVYSALADLYDGYDSSTETLSFTFPTE